MISADGYEKEQPNGRVTEQQAEGSQQTEHTARSSHGYPPEIRGDQKPQPRLQNSSQGPAHEIDLKEPTLSHAQLHRAAEDIKSQ